MNADPLWQAALALAAREEVRTVIDVGANEGAMTRMFLDAFPQARVHAFEPLPEQHARLQQLQAGQPRLAAVRAALGEREGRTRFHVGHAHFTSSRFARNASGRRYYRSDFVMADEIEVPLDTLDGYAARHGIEHVQLLKLDTQGGELAIVQGAARLLSQARIDVIVTEFFVVPHYEGAPLLDALWSALRGHGYELFDLFPGPRALNGQLRYGDAIFVSPRMRERHLDSAAPEP